MMTEYSLWASKAGQALQNFRSSVYIPVISDYLKTFIDGTALVQFRGAVQVQIRTATDVPIYSATISFTDDLPNGVWSVEQDDIHTVM